MKEKKAKRKFSRMFDDELRKRIRQRPRRRQWKLLACSDRPIRPAWEGFSRGSSNQIAITPVQLKGKIYWAVARTYSDENFLGKFFLLGPLALLMYREGVVITFWEDDPRALEYPLNHYTHSPQTEKPKRRFIHSPADIEKLQ